MRFEFSQPQQAFRYLCDTRLPTLSGGPNEGHDDTIGETVHEQRPTGRTTGEEQSDDR